MTSGGAWVIERREQRAHGAMTHFYAGASHWEPCAKRAAGYGYRIARTLAKQMTERAKASGREDIQYRAIYLDSIGAAETGE